MDISAEDTAHEDCSAGWDEDRILDHQTNPKQLEAELGMHEDKADIRRVGTRTNHWSERIPAGEDHPEGASHGEDALAAGDGKCSDLKLLLDGRGFLPPYQRFRRHPGLLQRCLL